MTSDPPRRPDPLVVVLPVAGLGLLLTWLHHPRMGCYLLAGAVGLAALARLVLPPRDAGLLVVRGRSFDVAVLAGLAAGLAVLAGVTPFPGAR